MGDRTVRGHTPGKGPPARDKTELETVRLRAEPLHAKHDAAEVLPKRFQIIGQLGEGGAGIVVAAHDTVLRRDVAIKVLHRHRDALEEARAAAELRHESIVTVYDVDPGGRYIVMELVDGETLQQRLARRGALPVQEVYELAHSLLGALAAAHERGIVHRDVKPANILYDRGLQTGSRVKLNDFGVARRLTSIEVTEIAGTPAYMAPEVWEGAEPDGRTDLFGVGVTLWEAAVGKPFRDDAHPEDFEAVRVLDQTRDARLATAIRRALATSPADRFQSAAEFAAALGPPPGMSGASGRFARASRRRWIAISAGAAAIAAAATIVAVRARGDGPADVQRSVVATIPFVDRTERLATARLELPALLAGELRHAKDIEVVGHDRLIGGTSCTLQLADAAAWRACAEQFHADAIVSGTLLPDGDRIAVELVVDRIDGTRLGRIRAHAASTSIGALVRRHAHHVRDLVAGRLSGDIAIDPDLDLGIDALHQGDYPEARRLFDAVLVRSPNQPDALYYLAIAESWRNAPAAEVDAAFERALAAKLTPMQEGIVRGFALIHHHELEASIAHWRKLAAEFPDQTLVQYGLSEALFHGGYPADGIATYRRLADADRDFRLGLMHPFDFYVIRGDIEGATWAVARNQRFGVRNLPEWQTRLRVLGGDLPGAYAALLAEDAEASRRGAGRPYDLGLIALALVREDRDLIASVLEGGMSTATEIAIGAWRGDRAITRHGFERQVSGARSRGRRGVYDIARIVPLISLLDDDKLVADALALMDELARPDPKLGVNEQLGRVFLLGRLRDRAGLIGYAKSTVPEVGRVASAFLAGLDKDGKRARDDWQQAFALSADGQFVMAGKAHLAAALHGTGDHAGVLATCSELLQPKIVDLVVGPATAPCLVWSGEALEATGKPEQAIAVYKRVLALRALTDHHHATAAAALRRLVR